MCMLFIERTVSLSWEERYMRATTFQLSEETPSRHQLRGKQKNAQKECRHSKLRESCFHEQIQTRKGTHMKKPFQEEGIHSKSAVKLKMWSKLWTILMHCSCDGWLFCNRSLNFLTPEKLGSQLQESRTWGRKMRLETRKVHMTDRYELILCSCCHIADGFLERNIEAVHERKPLLTREERIWSCFSDGKELKSVFVNPAKHVNAAPRTWWSQAKDLLVFNL